MPIKLIIFDLDGPILDSFEVAKKSLLIARKRLIENNLIGAKKLPELNERNIILNWGYPGLGILKRFFPLLKNGELKECVRIWAKSEKESESGKKIKFINGAIETLKKLKKDKYYTCILTSRSHNLQHLLGDINLEKLFDFIQTWDNPEFPEKEPVHKNHIFSPAFKPHPEVFNEIFKWANQKKIKKSEMLMIDDALVGLQAAKAVGITFLGVCTGPINSKKKWRKYGGLESKYVLRSITELQEWLKKNKSMRT